MREEFVEYEKLVESGACVEANLESRGWEIGYIAAGKVLDRTWTKGGTVVLA